MTSGELWATDALYLNDASEFVYLLGLLTEEVDTVVGSQADASPGTVEVARQLYRVSCIGKQLVTDDISCFVTCFCEDKDLLSQWRGYGGGMGGFSIGFKRDAIEAANEGDFRPYEFQRVHYDELGLRAQLREHALEAFGDYGAVAEDEQQRVAVWHELGGRFAEVTYQSLLYKHLSFAEEREWRIVTRVRRPDLTAHKLLRLRLTTLGLVPYVDLNVSGPVGRPLIGEVVIGPSLHPELAERSVRLLLETVGYMEGEVVVSHSRVPLRA